MTTIRGEDAYNKLLKCLNSKRGYRQWLFDRKKNERYVQTIKKDIQKTNIDPIAPDYFHKRVLSLVNAMGPKKKNVFRNLANK